MAPSAVPYLEGWEPPCEMGTEDLPRVKAEFVALARRAARIGFDLIELRMAHGYLFHQFLSPITNLRGDAYGGVAERRMHYPLEVFEAVRAAVPAELPVTVRVSATDWVEGGWDLAQSEAFCRELKNLGCGLVDVTSGGLDQRQALVTGPGYQTGMADRLRRATGVLAMAAGEMTDPLQAETIVRTGQADMVALARAFLWDPRWIWKPAAALGAELDLPAPYARANPALRAKPIVRRN